MAPIHVQYSGCSYIWSLLFSAAGAFLCLNDITGLEEVYYVINSDISCTNISK